MPRRTTPSVDPLDWWADEFMGPFYRVSHCAPDQVLDLAYAYDPQPEHEDLAVLEQGVYRCSPCVCGEGHGYDLNRAAPGGRGAFYAWIVGVRWTR